MPGPSTGAASASSASPAPLGGGSAEAKPEAEDAPATGLYGRRLRLIPSDPAATLACRDLTAAEKAMTEIRYRVPDPSPAAAVDVAEGWTVVAWVHKGLDRAFLTDGGEFAWGTSYQAIPADGTWRGTHTNVGVALADGARALRIAQECVRQG